ncbi:SAM-dependent methyltransferase [Streptacidiphilus albus]|uniref:SAM-dependent methyltransferase n=1 Tax=Streptacidiphilus albus TaxID=105425 RepID=UPI0009DF42F9|nr:SAM-dependent methyltransferase [Streptacidiphilus albus]
MAHIVFAHQVPDAAAEFISVLDLADEDVSVVLTGHEWRSIALPHAGAKERLHFLADAAARPATGTWQPDRSGPDDSHWAHSPADWRQEQARSGLAAAAAVGAGRIRYSLGHAGHSQFLVSEARPLSVEQLRTKIDVLAGFASGALPGADAKRQFLSQAAPSCESFLALTRQQAEHLYYLMYSPDPLVKVPRDPWDFDRSAYEQERLSATRDWVRAAVPGPAATLVEAGACEGSLTELLCDAGFRVTATEPAQDFRERLGSRVAGRAEVTAATVEDLAGPAPVPADAYLLAEVMYYLDDLAVVESLPTDLLLVTAPRELLESVLRPYFEGAGAACWRVESEQELLGARLDFLVDGLMYQRKRGSVGLTCRRR